ncbi:MAG: YkgJ family cysteine cluster protein [Chloroflexi bacterium]|nr:YkgJ family cysteine cluster protein [Chloroflexota bacterium]
MPVYLKTLDGQTHAIREPLTPIECFRCGVCCVRYQPPVTGREIARIAWALDLPAAEFMARYVQDSPVDYLLRQGPRGCVFLLWNAGGTKADCAIHRVRPDACRAWSAGLARPECQQGLRQLGKSGKLLLSGEIYDSEESVTGLNRRIMSDKP